MNLSTRIRSSGAVAALALAVAISPIGEMEARIAPQGGLWGSLPPEISPSGEMAEAPQGQPVLRVTSFVPRFLEFHQAAREAEREALEEARESDVDLDPEELEGMRWALWDEYLGEAAEELARGPGEPWEPQGLEEVWSRYGDRLERIRAADAGLSPDPQAVLREVAQLLRLDVPLEVHLIKYVGTFRDDPAFRLWNGNYTLLLPVESLPATLRPLFVDLSTRAIHARLSGRPEEGDLSLAQHLFLRGLALRVHEEVAPGLPAQEYLLRSRDWLLTAEQRDGRILDGVRQRLGERDPGALEPYLDGGGTTGLAGEFDYAAWRISGLLLMDGWTLDRLARVPEHEVDDLVAEILRGD